VSNVADGANEKLTISGATVPLVSGTVIASGAVITVDVSGTTVTVAVHFDTAVTTAYAASLIENLYYRNAKPASTVGNRVVTLRAVTDDGGGQATRSGVLGTSIVAVARETVPPLITSVAAPAIGFYRAGQYLTFTVSMTEDVIVTGVPSIDLVIGSTTRQLEYSGADSTSTSLVFKYLLVTGDVDNDGIEIGNNVNLNTGDAITDLAENPGILTFTAPSTSGIKVNLPPVANDDTASAKEMGGIGGSGNVLTNDTDNENDSLSLTAIRLGGVEGAGAAGTLGSPLVGMYGTLTIGSDGSYTYVIDENNPTVEALKEADSLTDSFNYSVTDGSSIDKGVLVVTINGADNGMAYIAPVITPPPLLLPPKLVTVPPVLEVAKPWLPFSQAFNSIIPLPAWSNIVSVTNEIKVGDLVVDHRLILQKMIPDQYFKINAMSMGADKAGIIFNVPKGTFVHTDPRAVIKLAALKEDGSSLPSWLNFDDKTGQFKGVPPKDYRGELVVKVIAYDDSGREVETLVKIQVTASEKSSVSAKGKLGLSSQFKAGGVMAWKAERDMLIRQAREVSIKSITIV
jgi:VCBS repeat-containing protein